MKVLNNLNPKRVFYFFEDICSIPHGSGNTDEISDYCVRFALSQGLEYKKDKYNNVIIKKPASIGYEEHQPVIIQGHLDMVCEKDTNCTLDLKKDGLILNVDGDAVYAKGTTLGGDDGIAIAMALSILEDKTLPHPPIEAVFTTDEETGMYGAEGIDASYLHGKTLLNIDSEQEGILTVSCAGGARAEIEIDLAKEKASSNFHKITVSGLKGGHSGIDINKCRLNSNIMMGRFLHSLPFDYRIADIHGGLKDNAIPRMTECIVSTDGNIEEQADKFIKSNATNAEPNFTIKIEKINYTDSVFAKTDSLMIADFLSNVTNGVVTISNDIDGLVQTSLNLGILRLENNKLHASFAVRSSVNSEKEKLLNQLKQFAGRYKGNFSEYGHYPAWEYRKESKLRDIMVNKFKELYGKEPIVEAIHAGLECGLFCDKIKDLDAVSFGPNMTDIHTTREKLYISSTERTYNYLCEILKEL